VRSVTSSSSSACRGRGAWSADTRPGSISSGRSRAASLIRGRGGGGAVRISSRSDWRALERAAAQHRILGRLPGRATGDAAASLQHGAPSISFPSGGLRFVRVATWRRESARRGAPAGSPDELDADARVRGVARLTASAATRAGASMAGRRLCGYARAGVGRGPRVRRR
jgi:hypothetical protein